MSASAGAPSRAFRPDIEGLRAVAVLLVLLFHAGVPWLPGGFAGVDVFFVISGFLITGLLVREARLTGTVRLRRFWARRARRLLPASALVLVATVGLTVLAVPQVRWREIGWDVVTSALYVVNWRLADRSVDYLAEGSQPSPVQHFWSLAVEEQFYLLWPLLVLLAAVLVRRRGRGEGGGWGLVRVTALLLALVAVPSFAWSVHLTGTDREVAYFVTTTRLWQLGVGALLALAVQRLSRLPARAGAVLAWAGLLAIGLGAVLQGAGPGALAWPGAAALVPTLGAAAVIAGGTARGAGGALGPGWLLGRPVMQRIGALSYSLYLWHWPLLAVAAARWGPLDVWAGLGVVALSAVPAWLSYHLVEQPVRHHRRLVVAPAAALATGLVCSLVAAAAGGALVQQVAQQVRAGERAAGQAQGAGSLVPTDDATATPTAPAAPSGAQAGPDLGADLGAGLGAGPGADPGPADPGAADGIPVPDGTDGAPGPQVDALDLTPVAITPDPLRATEDLPALYADGCDADRSDEVVTCTYGDPEGDLVLAAVGDSKIAQWGDALDRIGRERGWQVRLYYRSACPWTAALRSIEDRERALECQVWGEEVTGLLIGEDRPDVVLVSSVTGHALPPDGSGESTPGQMADGLVTRWSAVAEVGVPVVALADTPGPSGLQVPECVAEHRDDVSACTIPVNDGSGTGPLREAVARVPTSTFVTMNDWVCPGQDACPPVVGEVLVFRQGSHITTTYAVSLAEVLGARLEHAFAGLGVGVGQR